MTNDAVIRASKDVVDQFEKYVQGRGFLRLGSENKRLLSQFAEWLQTSHAHETVDVHSLPNGIILQRIKDAIGPELFDMQSGATWLQAIEAVTSPSANTQKACEHCGERHAAGPCKDAVIP